MAIHPAGIVSDLSAANATVFNRIELNPTTAIIHVTELGISMNGAPNSTLVPVEFNLRRTSTIGTGAAGTVVKIDSSTAALGTTALVENTADGTPGDFLHRWFVPVVSGMIWVAAPNREPDCALALFIGLLNVAALGASINATTYMVFEE